MTAPLRVLIAHNAYQHRGGEDSVVEAETALLRERGHEVARYGRNNDEIAEMGRVRLARDTVWSTRTVTDVAALIARFRPDVIHVHNTLPLISPSLYWAAAHAGVPVVQTLHNFRLLCPQAMFLRQGRVCEDCLGKLPWRGAVYRCYRHSLAESSVLAAMLTLHRTLTTFRRKVTRYIALNEFCRRKFIQGGLPARRLVIKPNFVDVAHATERGRAGGLYVGRLAPEKGIDVIVGALALRPGIRVTLVGSGPLETRVHHAAGVSALGPASFEEIVALMRRANYLILPSMWYENFPRTLVEAFACGLPAIASRLGALAELVEDGRTGLLFEAGSAEDLARKLEWAEAHPERMREMGINARRVYEVNYTPERNYRQLMAIYAEAVFEADCGRVMGSFD